MLLFFALPLISHAQKSEVIIDSADNAQAIFSKSLAWIATTWKSANDVVQLKDESNGTIIVKGGLSSTPKSLGMPVKGGLTMTDVTIRVKEGKAKIEFSNTNYKWQIGTLWTLNDDKSAGQFVHWKESTLKEIDGLISSYKASLLKKEEDF
jgi:hypothetical protein